MKLYHQPFDRGIDQSMGTSGGQQTTALRAASNLWHRRANELTTRPGVAEYAVGELSGVGQAIGFYGGSTVGIAGGRVSRLVGSSFVRPASNLLPPLVPHNSIRIGSAFPPNANGYGVRACAGGNFLFVSWHAGGGTTRGYSIDLPSGQVAVTASVPSTSTMLTSRAGAPVHAYNSGTDVIVVDLQFMTGSWTGFSSATIAGFAASPTLAPRIVSHSDGSMNIAYFAGGNFYMYHISASNVRTTVHSSARTVPAHANQFRMIELGNGGCLAAWLQGGNLYTVGSFQGAAAVLNSVATTRDWLGLERDGSGGGYVFTGDVGTMERHDVNGSYALSAATVVASNARPAGSSIWISSSHAAILPIVLHDGTSQTAYSGLGYPGHLPTLSSARSRSFESTEDQSILASNGRRYVVGVDCVSFDYATGNPMLADAVPLVLEVSHFADHQPQRAVCDFSGSPTIVAGDLCVMREASPNYSGGSAVLRATVAPPPRPASAVGSNSTGGLTPSTTYQLCTTYEMTDESGVTYESARSQTISVVMGASDDTITLTLGADHPWADGWRQAIYMTTGDGTIFRRYLSLVAGEARTYSGGTAVAILTSDTALDDDPALYSESGELPNDPAPAARFGVSAGLRLWLGGLFYPFRVHFSKETLRGEAPRFPDNPTNWIDLPFICTALAAMDDAVLAFGASDVALIYGAGPDARGTGGFSVRLLGTGVGATDWRSVTTCAAGVVFAGGGSIWLIPHGLGSPVHIGSKIRDELDGETVVSVAVVNYAHGQAVHFLVSGGQRLVWFASGALAGEWYSFVTASTGTLNAVGASSGSNGAGVTGALLLRDTTESSESAFFELVSNLYDVPLTGVVGIPFSLGLHNWSPGGVASDSLFARSWLRYRLSASALASFAWFYALNGASPVSLSSAALTAAANWRNSEYGLQNRRAQSVALSMTGTTRTDATGDLLFAGITVEYDIEGAAKEAIARRQ